jgi:large subunit ribosomal protein L10
VIKNTLMRRALEGTDAAGLESLFEGPSAVAFVREDPVAAAKSVTAASRRFPTLILKGAFVEGRVLSADQAKALADLDSREVMLSKLAGLMKTELTRAAGTFQAAQARLLSLLEAFKAKLPAEEEARAAEQPAETAEKTEEPTAEAGAATPEEPEQTNEADAAASEGEE